MLEINSTIGQKHVYKHKLKAVTKIVHEQFFFRAKLESNI